MSGRHLWQSSTDSKSLWNYTLSPGWNHNEVHILRLAIIKYGCGNWVQIAKHFPTKTCGQLNLQTQRLFGQQSLAEYNKLHVDPLVVKQVNDQKHDILRKNGCVVNTGDNLTLEMKKKKNTRQ